MTLDYSQSVINDLEKSLETGEGYDVIIYAGENENAKELHAHSNILHIRSQYFRTAFSNEWANKRDGKFILKKPNISPHIFKIILRFIYCGKVDLTQLQGPELLKLLIAVDELNIQTLMPHVQEYLIKHRHEYLRQNPVELLEKTHQHESFTDLWDYYLKYIRETPEILFNSDKFTNLKSHLLELLLKQEDLLVKICENPKMFFNSDKFIDSKATLLELLLKRDDLNLDEIEIWDSLLKWCLAQNPSISQDITKLSELNEEETTIMERTIHGFVPLMRLYHISSEDFLDKVYPLKNLLPKDLVNDLFTFYLAPNRKSGIQPLRNFVKRQHAIFASWIDKKEYLHYNVRNIPYNFSLLYRASRDGNTTATFHAKCDNKGATIFIAKITNSEQIVGGYNPLFWDSSSSFKSTKDSFIFTFTNRMILQTAKVGYSYGDPHSVGGYPGYGPIFGRSHDLYLHSNWGSNPNSYHRIDIPKIFNVEDYEVYQVIKK